MQQTKIVGIGFAAVDGPGPTPQRRQREGTDVGAHVEHHVAPVEAGRQLIFVVDHDLAEDAAVDGIGAELPVVGFVEKKLETAVKFPEYAHTIGPRHP